MFIRWMKDTKRIESKMREWSSCLAMRQQWYRKSYLLWTLIERFSSFTIFNSTADTPVTQEQFTQNIYFNLSVQNWIFDIVRYASSIYIFAFVYEKSSSQWVWSNPPFYIRVRGQLSHIRFSSHNFLSTVDTKIGKSDS